MSRLTITLFRSLIITLLVLCTGIPAFAQQQECPPEVPATLRGAIAPNGPAIASQCPEACPNWVPGSYLSYGWGYDYLDFIEVQCSDAQQSVRKIYSTTQAGSNASTCWNCVTGCAGSNCPPGELCVPVPRSYGSDCQRYGCPAGYTIAERESVVNGEVQSQPYCVLTDTSNCIQPITVQLDGPSSIRTGSQCTWSATASGGSSTAQKSYTWYVSNNPVGYGPYYTGGRPSGTLVGHSWRLRVTVTDGVRYTSQEILVSESSSAPICFQ